ncbi:uncharacterized protein C05D11.13-like [Acropora muricata]|uniref:uncharacterized protein C05D11.13-like n=1 Tax=Acropora muricata TaxID=159855 RepID=UPI0034E5B9C8
MVFYNAYIPLLIRQANDVEENPGPTIFDVIDPTRTICADYSQGNVALFSENAGVVPFEIKGVFVRNNEPDYVNESPKIGRLPFNNKRNQMQPIKRKLKSLTETPEEKEKRLIIVRREYEKRKRVNESEESKEKRLAQQCLKRKKKRANESSESRKKRLATQSQYQRQKIANESAEFREERLLNQRHYQNKKISNESAECREKRL